ncbi:2-hydroxyacid dehydrogenase [Roseicitreum antarcticum]|uniref:Gluconate 2-dehydrogenase n=1 Tax=Roseicitreum antarcticum TaxID=564137 RepID=A0A1H2R5C4_9RHOB|nr:D-glycerate dehydrogenase [Roseicitreum antarcticum]SDW14597.1 gluconate 2-dehydrogenase [Roseicitreum antarcticum]
MRLLITRPLPPRVVTHAEAHFDVALREKTTPMTPAEMRSALTIHDVVLPTLGDMFSAGIFAEIPAPRCRLLANFGVGYNHIDTAAARAVGVRVTNTPGAVTDATADVALTLMLMSARRAGEGERMVRAGRWQGWHPTQMLGMHLSGKVLGVIGMGRIGRAIARRAHFGFGMEVVFFNRSPVADAGVPAQQLGSIPAVMAAADMVVIAVPGGAETHHLIGAVELAAMQSHAHIINIARGDVLSEAALIAALQSGQIAGAGLDVYEFEPKVPDALRALENVVLLPHLGTAALEVREAMGMMAVDNAIAHLEGRDLPNPV